MKKRTTVINWHKEEKRLEDVYIGRPSAWENPFKLRSPEQRKRVLLKYAKYLLKRTDLLARIPALRGKRLLCFCTPKPCHGHILARLANSGKVTVRGLSKKLKKLIEEMET